MDEELISFRGLQDGRVATPLRDFWGVLEDYKVDMRDINGNKVAYVNISFSLDPSIDIIETLEPYNFPIAQLSFPLNKRRTSQWTVLADSATKLIATTEDISSLIKSKLHMKLVSHLMWDARQGKETPRDCWEITEVQKLGATASSPTGGASPTDRALELLDGCSEQEWNQKVFQDTLIKGDVQLLTSIIQKTFLPAMTTAGRASKDETDIWHIS